MGNLAAVPRNKSDTRMATRSKVLARWLIALFIIVLEQPYRQVEAQEVISQESLIRLRYEKWEVMVPMRDGVKLHTVIFSPKDTTKNISHSYETNSLFVYTLRKRYISNFVRAK
jgi:predicted acyl esterase